MTRRDRIVVLLENYLDVLNGLQDRAFRGDDFLPRMCRAWSHPSYRELERLRVVMRDSEPIVYWHIAETYFRADYRRVSVCPKCGRIAPAALIGEFCKHGKPYAKAVTRIAAIQKRTSAAVRPELVTAGVGWLDDNWRGEPFIPDDLLARAA